ncbi:MAG: YabP/YqfC family sporulation protein [Clostridia bacterium]|nr:YabP/YqfC family sporulation protein [Clostridia bacterium]
MKNYSKRKNENKKQNGAGAVSILRGCPYIHITDGRELTVEGNCRILEYTDEFLCVLCGKRRITVSGRELCVRLMDGYALVVCGIIHSVGFEG